MDRGYKEQCELVIRQIKKLIGAYRERIKHLDISESEFWVWYILNAKDGEITQQDICRAWSLPKQTVNTIITQLKSNGFLQLEAIPGTKNHKVIRLTDAGRAYSEDMLLPFSQAEERAFSRTPDDDIALVTRVFGKYIEVIKEELNGTTGENA